jgi:acetyl esterase/lipase
LFPSPFFIQLKICNPLPCRQVALRSVSTPGEFIGTPEHIADLIQLYYAEEAADGFFIQSAGASLAALAGTLGNTSIPLLELEYLSLGSQEASIGVQAVVDWYGPINFLEIDDQFRRSGLGSPNHGSPDSSEAKYLGQPIADVPKLVRQASAETYITSEAPPFFIQHGTLDERIPTEQSILFAEALERAIGRDRVTLELIEGAGHGGPAFASAGNIAKVLDFLDRHLAFLYLNREVVVRDNGIDI